jgi:hypothetical protein
MINFDRIIEQIRAERDSLLRSEKNLQAEYCYQLVSLLLESQKLINGEFWSIEYVEEKTDTLKSLRAAAERLKRWELENWSK